MKIYFYKLQFLRSVLIILQTFRQTRTAFLKVPNIYLLLSNVLLLQIKMEYQIHKIESEVEEVEEAAPATVLELIDDSILKQCVSVPISTGKHPI